MLVPRNIVCFTLHSLGKRVVFLIAGSLSPAVRVRSPSANRLQQFPHNRLVAPPGSPFAIGIGRTPVLRSTVSCASSAPASRCTNSAAGRHEANSSRAPAIEREGTPFRYRADCSRQTAAFAPANRSKGADPATCQTACAENSCSP